MSLWTRLEKSLKIIVILLAASFISDLLLLAIGRHGINNLPVIHLYGLIEAGLLAYFFMQVLNRRRYLITGVMILYVVYYVINSIFFESIFSFNANARAVEAVIMLVFCLLYFYQVYQTEEDIFIDRSPHFLIIVGTVIYFAGAFFSFLLATNILLGANDNLFGSWVLHNASNILKHIVYTFAMWRAQNVLMKPGAV